MRYPHKRLQPPQHNPRTSQWGVVKAAPLPVGIASILAAIATFQVVVWLNSEKEETLKERLSFCTERLGEQCKATNLAVENAKVARETDLQLLIYDDERNPTKITDKNVWRWVWLKHFNTGVTTDGTISRVTTLNLLFISFETPMTTSSVEIRSPDFALPPYEVNSFYPRFAIITFQGQMPAGTLEISMRP